MATKIVDKILPTTMVGSYPRPQWFKHQLLGRDVRVAFKEVQHEEAYHDAVATVIRDQEEAGLDIVTDGNMWYDDYVGVIGSFCWYMYERIGGFEPSREPHPSLRERRRQPGSRRSWTTGAASSTAARSRTARSGSPICTRLPRKHSHSAGQGVGGRRPREPRLARLLQALQERRRN